MTKRQRVRTRPPSSPGRRRPSSPRRTSVPRARRRGEGPRSGSEAPRPSVHGPNQNWTGDVTDIATDVSERLKARKSERAAASLVGRPATRTTLSRRSKRLNMPSALALAYPRGTRTSHGPRQPQTRWDIAVRRSPTTSTSSTSSSASPTVPPCERGLSAERRLAGRAGAPPRRWRSVARIAQARAREVARTKPISRPERTLSDIQPHGAP